MTQTNARAPRLFRSVVALQAGITIVSLLSLSFPMAALASPVEDHKITICHEGQVISVDEHAFQNGHDGDFQVLTDADATRCHDSATTPQSCTIVSDTTTTINDQPSVLTFVHAVWTTALNVSGAKWIWKSFHVDTSLIPDTTTFVKKINVVGTPTSATLEIAADNTYTVDVNGSAPSCDGTQLDNFTGTDTCPITLHSGINTLTFTVTNTADANPDPEANPAGLDYKVTINGASCADVPPPPPVTGKLTVVKQVVGAPQGVTAANFNIHVKTTGLSPADVDGSPKAGSEAGSAYTLAPGSYTVSEDTAPNYTTTYSEFCANGNVTLAANEEKSCTITNTYVPPVVNTCVAPTAGEVAPHITFGSSSEATLQTVLTNAGYSLNADTDQKNFQVWTGSNNTVHFSVKMVKKISQARHVFGYYTNNDTNSFVPVFKDGGIPGYEATPLKNEGETETFTVSPVGASGVGFAIVAFDGTSTSTPYATQKSLNGGADRAVVYNPSSDQYVLAFDDQATGRDNDYNDIVTAVTVTGCEDPTSDVTLCKTDDAGHPLAGWNLILKGMHLEDLLVPTNSWTGVNSVTNLTSGVSYLATVAGTWNNQGTANPADAEYSTTDSWTTHMDGYTGYGAGILETEINQADGNWGPYNSSHQYAQSFTPSANGTANFRIFDGDTGTHVQNEGWFADNSGSLAISLFKGYAGVTGENGCVVFHAVPYGSYNVGETPQDGWTLVEQQSAGEVSVNHPTEHFTVVNHQTTNDNTATLVAQKVVCTDEKDLPNWGAGGADITATTAADWVAEHKSCSLVDWNFQWAPNGTSNPGDNVTGTPTGWTSFAAGANTPVPSGALVWVRENINESYIPFTGQNTTEDVSAELYCSTDVLNYDNYDFIDPVTKGSHYYCVGFNSPKPSNPTPTFLKVHIFKYLSNGDGGYTQVADNFDGPQFPMVTTYSAANIGSGSNVPYVLGNQHGGAAFKWAADTASMQAPANYETHEVTGGDSVVVANQDSCSPGKYYLVGYKNGDSLAHAEAAAITPSPTSYVGITADQYQIVINRACPSGTTHTDETIIVKATDLATSVADAAVNTAKWFFYNDNNDTVNDALGSFVTGPATAPLSTGSAQVTLDATNNRTNLSTFGYGGVKLSDIKTLAYSAYSVSGVAGPNESPYLVMNVDFNNSNTWQKRLVYVPANNGSVPQNTWNTNDTINSGNGMWVYSGTTWPSSAIPGTTARSWSDILAAYPNARILPSDPHMGVRVGEPGPTGYTGNIDKFVIGVQTGSNIDTKTFDFEPTAQDNPGPTTFTSTIHTHSSSGGGGGTTGKVLGESTSTPNLCGPLLTSFLKLGWKNDPEQVKKLQQFLNDHLGLHISLTGFFGPITFNAVKTFQKSEWEGVLKPWFGKPASGITDPNTPTGFVYQTTKWRINNIWCPGSEDFPTKLD